ncbi:MAG: signal peptide peptidase SppA [Deltaproteobacteria bacterium]|nr:signal peptide peptidase SppA [Deltaproteobacteria bacterium]NIS78306.1 signal peptide peptidase SppA [Deltaproteobacteria bacterium]
MNRQERAVRKRSPLMRGCLILVVVFAGFLILMGVMGKIGGSLTGFRENVGVVKIEGIITDSETINESIRKFGKDEKIKAVVLRINSPGGGVGPSQEIYQEVKRLRDKKIVVASIGAVGASGGYYIACGANKIVANPGSITGSIGVIMEFLNVKELVEKLGLKGMVVKSGPMKDVGNPLREMTKEEKRFLKKLIDNIHIQFVDAVADGRKLERSKVEVIADGRIFSGSQAKELGLVDSLGNFYDAIDISAKISGIKGEPNLVYPPKKKISIIDLIKGEVKSIIEKVVFEMIFPTFVTN